MEIHSNIFGCSQTNHENKSVNKYIYFRGYAEKQQEEIDMQMKMLIVLLILRMNL